MASPVRNIITDVSIHDVANIFPLMSDDEFTALIQDIKENGQREPIWLHENKIIDGRNRYKACCELGIQPKYAQWNSEGSLVAFVMSQNLHRRHLTSSQKAVIALEVERFLADEAKKRQGQRIDLFQKIDKDSESNIPQKIAECSGEAREQAAKLTGTNRQYVSDAKHVQQKDKKILEKVRSGHVNVSDARKYVDAVEKYPEVKVISTPDAGLTVKHVLTVAKNLDSLPEDQRTEAREKLGNHDQRVLAELAERTPPREREYAAGESPGERWSKGLVKTRQLFMSIATQGGIKKLVGKWSNRDRTAYYKDVCELIETLTNIREDLENELSENA
jgi:hypothetical protein